MQQWSGMPYKERSVYKVFLEIQNVCTRIIYHLKLQMKQNQFIRLFHQQRYHVEQIEKVL